MNRTAGGSQEFIVDWLSEGFDSEIDRSARLHGYRSTPSTRNQTTRTRSRFERLAYVVCYRGPTSAQRRGYLYLPGRGDESLCAQRADKSPRPRRTVVSRLDRRLERGKLDRLARQSRKLTGDGRFRPRLMLDSRSLPLPASTLTHLQCSRPGCGMAAGPRCPAEPLSRLARRRCSPGTTWPPPRRTLTPRRAAGPGAVDVAVRRGAAGRASP